MRDCPEFICVSINGKTERFPCGVNSWSPPTFRQEGPVLCSLCRAAELAAVREESSPKMCPACGYRCIPLSYTLGDKECPHCKSLREAKQDLLSPGPCGKHRKIDWVVDTGAKGRFYSRPYREYCTACEREKPLVEALGSFVVFLSFLEAHQECAKLEPLKDKDVVAHFMGSGASDIITVGDLRKARAALKAVEGK